MSHANTISPFSLKIACRIFYFLLASAYRIVYVITYLHVSIYKDKTQTSLLYYSIASTQTSHGLDLDHIGVVESYATWKDLYRRHTTTYTLAERFEESRSRQVGPGSTTLAPAEAPPSFHILRFSSLEDTGTKQPRV